MDTINLKPGFYILGETVTNPKPDRRQRYRWSAKETWEKGRRFVIREKTEYGKTFLTIAPADDPYGYFPNSQTCAAQWNALAGALVPEEKNVNTILAATDMALCGKGSWERDGYRILVETGILTLDDLEALKDKIQARWEAEREAEEAERKATKQAG